MSVYGEIGKLIEYGLAAELIEEADKEYTINRLLDIMNMDDYKEEPLEDDRRLPIILDRLTIYAIKNGVINSGDIVTRDLFDTRLMSAFMKRPSEIRASFDKNYNVSPEKATENLFKYSKDINYIRRDRIDRDRHFEIKSKYGVMDATIKLSKTDKDPRAMLSALKNRNIIYPKCPLCMENVGYAGRQDHTAGRTLPVIIMDLCGEKWGFKFSQELLFNEHCVLFSTEHRPMELNENTFKRMVDFLKKFPHYFVGADAELSLVGDGLVQHEHLTGGRYSFAIERAEKEREFRVAGFEDVKCEILKWPLAVIRLNGENRERVVGLASRILNKWRSYHNESLGIISEDNGEVHNSVTAVARIKNGSLEMDMVLRNNATSRLKPMGIFNPGQQYQFIKHGNVDLVEVMGMAVLPARLDIELSLLEDCVVNDKPLSTYPELIVYTQWMDTVIKNNPDLKKYNAREILEQEVGNSFVKALEEASVFKDDREGRDAFREFTELL